MGRVLKLGFVDQRLAEMEIPRAELWRRAEITGTKANMRVHRGNKFSAAELKRIAQVLSVPIDAIVESAGDKPTTIGRALRDRLMPPSAGFPIIKTKDAIAQHYRKMTSENFVWVFSSDGFLEAHDPAFFEVISEAISKNVQVSYFFPDHDASRSISDFEEVIGKLSADYGRSILEKVRGYLLLRRGNMLYAEAARFVVFGTLVNEHARIDEILLYIRGDGSYWVSIPQEQFEAFSILIQSVYDPVAYVPRHMRVEGGLPALVQTRYQTGFSDTHGKNIYQELRMAAQTADSAILCAENIAEILKSRQKIGDKVNPIHAWLDIGCEDGEITSAIKRELDKAGLVTTLVGVDSSTQMHPHEVLKSAAFLNGPQWTFERFLATTPRDLRFDVITSVHSWYLVDPRRLIHAYRRLTERGILTVVIAPFKDNVINSITHQIDLRIREVTGNSERAYEGKVVATDAFRCYAEDIEAAARAFFGEDNVIVRKKKKDVPTNLFFNLKNPTSLLFSIIEFFAHGIIKVDDRLIQDVMSQVDAASRDGKVACDDWCIIVDKASILGRRRKIV